MAVKEGRETHLPKEEEDPAKGSHVQLFFLTVALLASCAQGSAAAAHGSALSPVGVRSTELC